MPIIQFVVVPSQVKPNEITTLESSFTEDDGTVVYEIAEGSPITFVDGLRKIEADVENQKDFTSTTLQGPKGGVRIAAYRKDDPNRKITKLVRLT